MATFICEVCRESFYVKPARLRRYNVRFCSRDCQKVEWAKEKRKVRSDGYVQVTGNGLNTLEHRLVMEAHLGRPLTRTEHVHHINEKRDDNRLENLEIIDIADHSRHHHPGRNESTWVKVPCYHCKKLFDRRKTEHKAHPKAHCSRDCYNAADRVERTCGHCGKQYTTKPSVKKRFCGHPCYRASGRVGRLM